MAFTAVPLSILLVTWSKKDNTLDRHHLKNVLRLIKRTITNKTPDVMLSHIKSLVRPHVEYCVSAWSPYYMKDKKLLERIQHRFTKLIPGLQHLPYTDRLKKLKLWSLEEWRNRADLTGVFKMAKNISSTPLSTFFELHMDTRTRGHSLKLTKHRCHWRSDTFSLSELSIIGTRWMRTQSQWELLMASSPVWRRRGDQRWACSWTSLSAGPRGRFNVKSSRTGELRWICPTYDLTHTMTNFCLCQSTISSVTGHFAYWTVCLLDILPTARTVRPQIACFAYKTARIKSDV